MSKFAALFSLPVMASAISTQESAFLEFVKQYGKQYPTEEVFSRLSVFKANVAKIEAHNAQGLGWKMAVNEFADLTADEFKARYTGLKVPPNFKANINATAVEVPVKAPAASKDWRAEGAVTPVKNQGQCGSCWAFSTTGAIESACYIKTHKLTSLSEQMLVDCSTSYGNNGCSGGLMDNGFNFVKAKGICTESSYPYTATDGKCKSCTVQTDCKLTGFKDVAKTETALLNAVNIEPVAIAIEADQSAFQFYSGGVMDGTCGKALDHGVLLVGYGTDSGKDYWIVKNSWGSSWGEAGYIRLVRGKDQCGLADMASYPIVSA